MVVVVIGYVEVMVKCIVCFLLWLGFMVECVCGCNWLSMDELY